MGEKLNRKSNRNITKLECDALATLMYAQYIRKEQERLEKAEQERQAKMNMIDDEMDAEMIKLNKLLDEVNQSKAKLKVLEQWRNEI